MAEVTASNGDGRTEADDPPDGRGSDVREARPREARASVVRAAVVVTVLVAAWWTARGDGGEPGLMPGQVLSGFFQAQRDGDCRRLVDLVSEASWSDGGERSRAEFLDQCDAALDGYRPEVDALDVGGVDEDGDRVTVSWAAGSAPEATTWDEEPPRGRLVREDGQWRVRLDDRVLHLGRSVPETVRGYLDAYNEADCERLVGLVSESAWPAGAGTRTERVRRCEQGVDAHRALGPALSLEVSALEVSEVEEERAETALTVSLGGEALRGASGGAETVRLVREGLQWRLAGSEDLPDGWDGAPLRAIVYAEIEARLADEVVTDYACSRYADNLDSGRGPNGADGAVVGITRDFSSCYALVGVHRFADGEQARRAARSMADALAGDPLPTARDLDRSEAEHSTGRDQSLAEWQEYVDTLRPNHRAEVAGVPDALGVRSSCDVEGCDAASAFVARGSVFVAVTMESGDLDDAAGILRAQLERL